LDDKVKTLLNKLTKDGFDSLSNQIIELFNNSKRENDGPTLKCIVRLIFEQAMHDESWAEVCTRLCKKMYEHISPGIIDESVKTQNGQPFSGRQLFRKYLLIQCREALNRGSQKRDAIDAMTAPKTQALPSKISEVSTAVGEGQLDSGKDHIGQKAERGVNALVKFIVELFKGQMLTERIMYDCIRRLLSNIDNPVEEEVEGLCQLLKIAGKQLDTPKAKNHMDVCFDRMQELTAATTLSPRLRILLLVSMHQSNNTP
jgi:translation initiation factor 4G